MRVTAERFEAAAAAVMADLFGDAPPPVAVHWIPPGDDPDFGEMRVEAPDGEGFGYTVFADSTDDDLRYQLAERIPEYLPELTVTWAGLFPRCPGHDHPAEPEWDEREQRGYWRCPRDRRVLAPIGALRGARGDGHASR